MKFTLKYIISSKKFTTQLKLVKSKRLYPSISVCITKKKKYIYIYSCCEGNLMQKVSLQLISLFLTTSTPKGGFFFSLSNLRHFSESVSSSSQQSYSRLVMPSYVKLKHRSQMYKSLLVK
jgi:hypothetical protein